MNSKRSPEDFRVTELLADGYLKSSGPYRIYKVTKRKLTSLEAAGALAELAGIPASEVGLAGLKDRQGITVQYMSVRGGRVANLRETGLTIEPVGFAREPLDASFSLGNAFKIRLRELSLPALASIEQGVDEVRRFGIPNYFDEQRFGNLRHGQGWVALDLMRGRTEEALRRLLCGRSEVDDLRQQRFKLELDRLWGDWRACREIAGRIGAHHSLFEHLRDRPDDFRGAFQRISRRVRLIHLYAFQSHLWNRSVARLVAELAGQDGASVARSIEGELVFPRCEFELPPELATTFPLPGEKLQGVAPGRAYALLEQALAEHDLRPRDFEIRDLPGFRMKPEERALFVHPTHMRVRMPEAPGDAPASRTVQLAFDLPRGAYATLVLKRLFARPVRGRVRMDRPRRAEDPRARERTRSAPPGARPPRVERKSDKRSPKRG